MRITYETGTGTLIQFIVLSFLNIGNQINQTVTACRHEGQCVSNALLAIIFYLLVATWFGSIWALGYLAQQRRSKRLAQLLICAEGLIALVAAFNAKHHTDLLSLLTSLIDFGLAVWIVTLAFRLMRAGGGRVVRGSRNRPRQRPTPSA
jgi:hypothetical protein